MHAKLRDSQLHMRQPLTNKHIQPQDAILFEAIISDLFPAAPPPAPRSAELAGALRRALLAAGRQPAGGLVEKAAQLKETLGVRFGVMLVGQAGGWCCSRLEAM